MTDESMRDHEYAAMAAVSPALLATTKTAKAYEMKFLLNPTQAEIVGAWGRTHLALDPHVDPSLGDAYHIRSVYFDTDKLDVFHRTPTFKRRKFRLRRYGSEPGIFLERKTKSGDRVSKRRTGIAGTELGRLLEGTTDPAWPGHWFHRKLLARQLKPRCLIRYERIAFIGLCEEGPIRLTLDRNIRCTLTDGCNLDAAGDALPLLPDVVVLELKFRTTLPALFKRLIEEMGINPGRASKYRLAIQAFGLAKEPI